MMAMLFLNNVPAESCTTCPTGHALIAAWFIGRTPQTNAGEFIDGLHHSYLALGTVTILSSLIFWRLRPNDGNNVSNRPGTPEAAEAA